ncbi:MAG TPA: sialidase family protein [Acidimicrobiales bacterium]|nr:sialidase family protein [Acidimicrobiales bacterium]HVM01168.1 sialidase family protein [Acidimicrobiales bacterium]
MKRAVRVAAVGAAALVLAAPATVSAQSGGGPRLTSPVRATADDLAPTRTYSAPYLLVDPSNPRNIVAAAVEMRTRICRLLRSTDAGATWKILDSLPGLQSYPFCFNTAGMQTETPIAWGRGSTLYYGLNGWDTQDGGQRANISVLLAKSTDLGDTWTTTMVRDARGRPEAEYENNTPVSSVAVDTSGPQDVVYVAWRRALPNQTNPAYPRAPFMAVSTDGGATFGDQIDIHAQYPKTVRNAAGQDVPYVMSFSAPSMATDSKGTLYVIYPLNTTGITPAPPVPIVIGRSTDRAQTFEFFDVTPPSVYTEHVGILKWGPAGGPDGTLHVIYEDKVNQPATAADRDIYYQKSTDRGATWSQPKLLNDDDPAELAVQITPNLDVTPQGRVDAAWWDFRDDNGEIATDVYYTYSHDNGDTWSSNIRLTDRSVNRRIGVWTGADIRQPPGLVSLKEYAFVGWDDTRLGDETTHTQDIFMRAVQFEALGGGASSTVRYALGAVIGLAAVGLILVVASLLARSGSGPPRPAPSDRSAAKADAH